MIEDYEGFDDAAAQSIGLADYGSGLHRRVLEQAILDLAGADAISGTGDHVVFVAHEPQVAVPIAIPHITGTIPVADEFGAGGVGVLPVLQEHDRVVPVGRELADFTVRHEMDRSSITSTRWLG